VSDISDNLHPALLMIDKGNVHEIIIVGGSTCIPRIVKLVSDFFNAKATRASTPMKPLHTVPAAAAQAAILSGNTSEKTQDLLLLDAAPLSLGFGTAGRHSSSVTPLFPQRNLKPS
jgi:heat shock 70kDa protein 1/2/6/8